MPDGKPAGIKCIHLLDEYKCALYGLPERPLVCGAFKAEPEFCGKGREEALEILSALSQ
ncbi:MAG: hypothetical protein WAL29_04560 [Bacteroidales bacterium]